MNVCIFFVGKLVKQQKMSLLVLHSIFLVSLGTLADSCLYGNVACFFTHLAASPTVEFSLFLNSIDVIGQAVSSVLFSPHILQLPDILPQ